MPTRCKVHHFKADLALDFSECFNLWNLSMLVSSNQLKLQAFFNICCHTLMTSAPVKLAASVGVPANTLRGCYSMVFAL